MADRQNSAKSSVTIVLRALLSLWAMGLMLEPTLAAAPVATVQKKSVVLDIDTGTLLELPEPAKTVFIANPDIADINVPEPGRVLVYAKKPGQTTVYALLQSGAVNSYALTVQHPKQALEAAIRKQAPTGDVKVSSAPHGVSVSGTVASPTDALAVKEAVEQHLSDQDKLSFNVGVREPTQVNLQVRVAEVSRQVDKQFGLNWNAVFNDGNFAVGLLTGREPLTSITNTVTGTTSTSFGNFARSSAADSLGFGYRNDGGTVNVSALMDALQAEGLVSVLAEPNLTAVSGQTATFLAGGEFPVPVAQGLDQVTIEWKSFGVSIAFAPTVLDKNHISIKVRPEVSELSNQGAVTINNLKIPSISVRRAETTVDLASGQSFAIAGLFLNNTSNEIKNFPGLGNIPVLGALFRSTSFQRNESELVFIVTPYIVRPVQHTSDLHLPNEGLTFANDIEQILFGRLTKAKGKANGADKTAAARPHLAGPAGFMLE